MLKRILVIVEGSSASHGAQKIAIDLAKHSNARLTGAGVLDTPRITAAQPEPLGGGAFKMQRDEEVIRKSHNQIDTLLTDFRKTCQKATLGCETVELEGFPSTEIRRLSHEHDLIVIGQTNDFHFEWEHHSDTTVKHIARNNSRPILAVPPPEASSGDEVLVAYDGSPQSARALHMFLLLGLADKKKVNIITVDTLKTEANAIADEAVRMCAVYNITPAVHAIATRTDPAKAILDKKRTLPIGMVVLGSFSHSSFSEFFFGSCATTLMRKSRVPLFIHH
ncbi:universal stress protein [Alphaproteobacteria bacterium]|nr:universal stress protein [Alphaproteobacteria bacterium]